MFASPDVRARLDLLETTEQQISARRRKIHSRLEVLRINSDTNGVPVTPQQLGEIFAEERQLSTARRQLHGEIDAIKEQPKRH